MCVFINDFFNSSLFEGILTGIISGFIVYIVTNGIVKKKGNAKNLEQINNANIDIIRSLKPYITESGLPSKEVIDAIIISTARKYKVKIEEVYSIRIVCEELIREIVENVYITVEKNWNTQSIYKNILII